MEYCEVSDSRGSFVGGILIIYIDIKGLYSPSVYVKKSLSCYNNQPLLSGGKGGCLFIEVIRKTYETSILNITLVGEIQIFNNNNVDYGGGVYISVPRLATNITFSGVAFYNNTALKGGSAIYIMIQEEKTVTLNDTYVKIINGLFYHNGKDLEEEDNHYNRVSLYTGSITELFGNLSAFVNGGGYERNYGSGIVATRSNRTVSGNVHFNRNQANTGVCFLLTKGSLLTIQAPSNITFLDNRAFTAGLIVALAFYNTCPFQFFTSKRQKYIALNVHNFGYYIGNCFIYSDALSNCNKSYFTNTFIDLGFQHRFFLHHQLHYVCVERM